MTGSRLSVRDALTARHVDAMPNGLHGINRFYTDHPAAHAFGYTRLRDVVKALHWPAGYSAVDDHPSDDGQDWQNNLQGLAHDTTTWFVTRRDCLQTIPVGVDWQGLSSGHFEDHTHLDSLGGNETFSFVYDDTDSGITRIYGPPGYDHLGALSIQHIDGETFLYIPMQDNTSPAPLPPIIYALQVIPDKAVVDHYWHASISQHNEPGLGDQGAWCAIDPVTQQLYTSCFFGSQPGSGVDVYSLGCASKPTLGHPVAGEDFALTYIGTMALWEEDGVTPSTLSRVQGGFITPNRHLYLVLDDDTGLAGFDLVTGRRSAKIPVDYDPDKGLGRSQELEGMSVYSGAPASSNLPGDLHVILWENGGGPIGQDLWLKNFAVPTGDIPYL